MYKIAFFGSDLFSLASFKEVLKLKRSCPDIVGDLSLVTRQLKVSGRGMKNIVKPEIVEYAQREGINWHEVETDQEFDSLNDISNLAIAVSYGKLIPANYLKKLQYGGLNVHPSLLPQYRGSSPLQWAIMDQQPFTGVSIQTLHPTKFDHGNVVWQSQKIPLHPRETTASLMHKLGHVGAGSLSLILEALPLPPSDAGAPNADVEPSFAPKIDKTLHKIDFTKTAKEMDARGRALDKLYFEQRVHQKQPKRGKPKGHPVLRVNLSNFYPVESVEGESTGKIGEVLPGKAPDGTDILCLKLPDGFLGAAEVTVQGFKPEPASEYFAEFEKRRLGDVICT